MKLIYSFFLTLCTLKAANSHPLEKKQIKEINYILSPTLGGSPEKLVTAVVTHRDGNAATETLQVVYFDEAFTITTNINLYMDTMIPSYLPTTLTRTVEAEVTAPASDFFLENGHYYLDKKYSDQVLEYAAMTTSLI